MINKTIAGIALLFGLFSISNASAESNICDTQVNPNIMETLGLTSNNPGLTCQGSYFNWGRGGNGWGYCYQWTCDGVIMNGGRPVPNPNCEATNPSYFDWGRGQNGWGYCYQWTPYGHAMNEGRPVNNWSCEQYRPSYYNWGRGQDGYVYCYQWTPYGVPMNDGRPVSPYYCQRYSSAK